MADVIYPSFKGANMGAAPSSIAPIDLNSDAIFIMLVTNTYVALSLATIQGHVFRSDITNEVAGTGYTAGGAALASLTLTLTAGNYVWDAADLVWATASFTARGAVGFKRVGADLSTPADDPVIALWDFGADKTASAGNFTIQWNASGLMVVT